MDKSILKMIGLIVGLVAIIAIVLFVLIKGVSIGSLQIISLTDIAKRNTEVEEARVNLQKAELQYDTNNKLLETAKKKFKTEKEEYELISDEKIAAIKEATKEEEYLIEYLWITLGNYATKHNLSLAIIEPGGTISATTESAPSDETTVSTGTGVTGNESGVNSTTNAATTGSPTSGTEKTEGEEQNNQNQIVENITANTNDLTVQVKGSYIDLADFVFEVENDKSLRFRLDNIKMKSAGGTEVITSFNVKDFTVLKYLE